MVDLAEQINKRISEYIVSESTSAEMREVAASMVALPLWSDMGGCIALKPDGSFVHHDWDTSKIAEENTCMATPYFGNRRQNLYRTRSAIAKETRRCRAMLYVQGIRMSGTRRACLQQYCLREVLRPGLGNR